MKRQGVFLPLPLDGILVHRRATPQHQNRRYSFIHLGWERHHESKVSCTRTHHDVLGQSSSPDCSIRSSHCASTKRNGASLHVSPFERTACFVTEANFLLQKSKNTNVSLFQRHGNSFGNQCFRDEAWKYRTSVWIAHASCPTCGLFKLLGLRF